MESIERASLVSQSAASKNKKLEHVLPLRDAFIRALDEARKCGEVVDEVSHGPEVDVKQLQGRDINVCVRIRPLLQFERDAEFFPMVDKAERGGFQRIVAVEPKLDFRKKARPTESRFDVDLAFNAADENELVYSAAAEPLIDLGLQGGVCTLLAYGQTGSGKTFTISGILERLARDLFSRKEGFIDLHLSFFELLGNKMTDLLDASQSPIDVKEDQFGNAVVVDKTEVEIRSADHFSQLVQTAFAHRKTSATFKNDQSSRSHAVCAVRVKNANFPSAEDGRIFIIDLAGSETAVDSQFHGRERVKETKEINKSLMALKECIRNRALAAMDMDKYYHIPYRQSKLTLLLKDAFEVESRRICKTVFIACVSPSCADSAMTMNTLRYVAPIKVGEPKVKVAPNPDNPANWDNATLRNWVQVESCGKIDSDILCPVESGMQMLRMAEPEFLARLMRSSPTMTEKGAKKFYTKLWSLLIDIRTLERRAKTERKKPGNRSDWSKELLERRSKMTMEERAVEDEQQRQKYLKHLFQEYKKAEE